MAYIGKLEVISGLKSVNGEYPIVDSREVYYEDGISVYDYLANFMNNEGNLSVITNIVNQVIEPNIQSINEAIEAEATARENADDALDNRLTSLEDEVGTGSGASGTTLTGRVAALENLTGDTISRGNARLDTRVTLIENEVGIGSGGSTSLNTRVSNLETTVAQIPDDVDEKIENLKNQIYGTTDTSTINEAYDTLKEVAEYIESDKTGAEALVSKVTALETLTGDDTKGNEALDDRLGTVEDELGIGDGSGSGTSISTRITNLEVKVGDDTSGLVKQVNANTTAIGTEPNASGEGGSGIQKKIYDLKKLIEDINNNIGDIDLDELVEKINQINELVAQLQDSDLASMQDSIDTLTTKVAALESSVGTNDTTAGTIRKRLKDAETDIDNLQTDVAALKNTVGNSSSGLVKDVADLKSAIGSSTSGLTKKVNDLESSISALATRVSTLESSVGTLQTDLSALAARVSTLETKMSTAESNITSLQNNKVDKVTGKSLILTEVADAYSIDEDSDYLEVTTDAAGRILEYIDSEGNKHFTGNVYAPNINELYTMVYALRDEVYRLQNV